MASTPSFEQLVHQVETLKKRLDECRQDREILYDAWQKYRSLVENANEAILVAQQGMFRFANPKAEDLLGYPRQELTAKPLTCFIHPEDSDMVMDRYQRRLNGETIPEVYPLRIIGKDGATRWVELKVKLFSWDNQPATLCFVTDISKRVQAEGKYHRVIESSSEGFIFLDSGLGINDVNHALLRISGFTRTDFIGHRIDKFYDKASVLFLSASRDHLSFEALFRAKSGHLIPMLFSRSIIKDDNGKVTGYMYFLTDLTELKAAQEELKKAEQRYRSMYQNALQGMFQSRVSGRIIRANPAFARILGYGSPHEVLALENGANRFYFDPEDRADMIREVRKKGAVENYELKLKRKDGKPVWILANIRLIDTDHGASILEGMLVDNTRKKALEKSLRQDRKKFRNLSIHDNLTGLYNTRHLYKALDELIKESSRAGTPFSLVFMDMDNFKRIVDTFGHLNGSQALKEVAATIKGCLQKPCFGVAYGGDEFVIVLPGFRKTGAMEKVEEIRLQMKQSTYLVEAGHNVRLGASFGIATFPEDSDNREGLLALADRAMFHIKQTGKDSIGVSTI